MTTSAVICAHEMRGPELEIEVELITDGPLQRRYFRRTPEQLMDALGTHMLFSLVGTRGQWDEETRTFTAYRAGGDVQL